MRKFPRVNSPIILLENYSAAIPRPRWQVYGERYAKRRANNKSFEFTWPQYQNMPLNQLLMPLLMLQTDSHCSYCDAYPLMSADNTIDHFKPKSKYPLEVCKWENLYIACAHCQKEKGTSYEETLLRPDEQGYDFYHYFYYDFTTHEIKILWSLTEEDAQRAEATLRVMNFNHPAMKESRRLSYEGFADRPDFPLNDKTHRFMFE